MEQWSKGTGANAKRGSGVLLPVAKRGSTGGSVVRQERNGVVVE